MSVGGELVIQAEQVLSDGPSHGSRVACWVARSALEAAVIELLRERHLEAAEATMRSRLTCLQVAYADNPDIAAAAEYAWAGLSQASHQHAFQLSPTHTEASHLLGLVSWLVEHVEDATRPP